MPLNSGVSIGSMFEHLQRKSRKKPRHFICDEAFIIQAPIEKSGNCFKGPYLCGRA